MSKKRFIEAVIIRTLPNIDKLDAAIDYAEALYQALSRRGYGENKSQPNPEQDWYAKLSARQKRGFDRFWQAFGMKKGKNGAAMRWYQLGEKTDAQYQPIIDAAKKEAEQALPPGQARKMAQGWLQEKRYLDDQANKQNPNPNKQEINRLKTELNGLQQLYEHSKNEQFLKQIQQIEQAIDDARKR